METNLFSQFQRLLSPASGILKIEVLEILIFTLVIYRLMLLDAATLEMEIPVLVLGSLLFLIVQSRQVLRIQEANLMQLQSLIDSVARP